MATSATEEKQFTRFAPAERVSREQLLTRLGKIKAVPAMITTLEAMPQMVIVLDSSWQIVFATDVTCRNLGAKCLEDIQSLRPGEVFRCANVNNNPSGCGTGKACKTCGTALAILSSLQGQTDSRECRIVRSTDNKILDLQVTAVPVSVEGEPFCIISMEDISHEKRRRILERVLFYDVLGLAGVAQSLSSILSEKIDSIYKNPAKIATLVDILRTSIGSLVEEITAQKDLLAAENGDLKVAPVQIRSIDLLQRMRDLYQHHEYAYGRTVRLSNSTEDTTITTDMTILSRVIGNMIKNALEASEKGQTVKLGCCKPNPDTIRFTVHNKIVIPENIQLQIFARSFSTKGSGRGLGTYSIKLFGESFLKGKVGFSSSARDGTTFYIDLPPVIHLP